MKLKSDFHIAGQLMESHPEYSVCIIHALAVGYAYRGQGLGKILVNHMISDAKESGSE